MTYQSLKNTTKEQKTPKRVSRRSDTLEKTLNILKIIIFKLLFSSISFDVIETFLSLVENFPNIFSFDFYSCFFACSEIIVLIDFYPWLPW